MGLVWIRQLSFKAWYQFQNVVFPHLLQIQIFFLVKRLDIQEGGFAYAPQAIGYTTTQNSFQCLDPPEPATNLSALAASSDKDSETHSGQNMSTDKQHLDQCLTMETTLREFFPNCI